MHMLRNKLMTLVYNIILGILGSVGVGVEGVPWLLVKGTSENEVSFLTESCSHGGVSKLFDFFAP